MTSLYFIFVNINHNSINQNELYEMLDKLQFAKDLISFTFEPDSS